MEHVNYDVKLNENGRIVIPAALRQECGLRAGDSLKISHIDGNLVISSPRMALRYLQDMIQQQCPDVDLVEEIFKMRQEEVRREEEYDRR